ncbi:hypothetical protein [Microbacterium tenebrionis]|uniref:hypothetical protein n=1 Tax=Microbacterium tenebrionis TaxID=2830665 RepID=UPI00202AE5C2|nr:hypothetical protein [Microbacterium ihumii]
MLRHFEVRRRPLAELAEDVWGLDLRVVQRPFTLVGVKPALDAFTDVANELKENAEKSARSFGQELAATRGKVA